MKKWNLEEINNWADMPPEEQGSAIMINVDEMAELLAPSKGKSEETQEKAEFQGQCQNALESIARLGQSSPSTLSMLCSETLIRCYSVC